MTHLVLPEQWTFNGVDLSTYAYLVGSADPDGFPDLRGDDTVVPGLPGRVYAGKVPEARRIPLAIYVCPVDEDGDPVPGQTDAETARANLDALYTVFGIRGLAPLVRTMPSGSSRTASAEVVKVSNIEDRYGHQLIGLVADLSLPDPFFYGVDVLPPPVPIVASPTDFALTHPGTVRGHRIVLDFVGPILNPKVTQTNTGIWVEIDANVAAGKHLVVDCSAWTATNDGANAIGSVRHSGATPFLVLEPGVNPLRVEATSPGGALAVTFRPPYL